MRVSMNEFLEDFADNLVKKSAYKGDCNAYIHTAISVIGGLLGNLIKAEGEDVYPNLYSMLLGDTGQGKSSYAQTIIKYVSKIQMTKTKLSDIERRKRKKEQEERKKNQKENPNIELEYKAAPYPKGVYYESRSLFVPDATREALEEHAAKVSWGNMFLFKDELGGFFDSFKKAGREEDQTAYNSLYNPNITHEVFRKTKDAKIPIIYYPVMNITGCTTLGTVKELIDSYKKKKRHDGILSRFQHVYILPKQTREMIGLKEREVVEKNFDYRFKELLLNIVDRQILVGKKKKAEQKSDVVEDNDGFIVYIGKSPEAERIYTEYALETRIRMFDCKDIMFKEYLTRNPEFVLKIALIFHAIKRFSANLDIFAVDEENRFSPSTMLEAVEYVKMITKKAESLFVEEEIQLDTSELANKIFDYISQTTGSFWKKYSQKPWTARELATIQLRIFPRKGNNNIDMEGLYQVLDYLVSNDKLHLIEEEHPRSKKIITKYSFFTTKPTEPPKVDGGNNEDKKERESSPPQKEERKVTRYEKPLSEHIKDIKERIDTKEFIGQYLRVKKGFALCPFHEDKNPSLSVTKEFYHCFSCGAHGSVFDFLIQHKGLSFSSALKELEGYTQATPLVIKDSDMRI